MSNPIPPFVCSTPPPIDCIVDTPPPPVEDDFGDFAAVDDQFEASSLPVTPVHVTELPGNSTSTNIHSSMPPTPDTSLNVLPSDDNEGSTTGIASFSQDKSQISSYAPASSKLDELSYIIEASSPPPFDFEPVDDDDLTPCDDLIINDDDADEFQEVDVGKYDDNISLPSLKFDSLNNISKSTTPVSDELIKSTHEDADTLSSFQPITTAHLEAVAPVLKDDQSVEEESLSNEMPAVVEESKLEPEINIDSGKPPPVIENGDSDFNNYEAFPSVGFENDIKKEFPEACDDELQQKEPHELKGFAFEADFSQFSSSNEPIAYAPHVTSQILVNRQLSDKSSLDDLEADDFDDFQDFATATPVLQQTKTSHVESSSPSNLNEIQKASEIMTPNSGEDDDDDFGEFSEVIESNPTTIPSSNSGFNLSNLNEKLKPILEMMFPFKDAIENQDEQPVSNLKHVTSSTTINQIDTAKALEYQWNNSEVRHSLIKSLGVDSRNILYGEKWNSSMPRYAANLSFNPLEPMKSDKSNTGSSKLSTIDYRKRSESLTSTSSSAAKADVPAVEFDWNSSGLVNPLDGVKEILHERPIETIYTKELGESHTSTDQQSNPTLSDNTNIYSSDKTLPRFINKEAISTTSEFKSHADASAAISATTTTAARTPTVFNTTPPTLSDDYIDITCDGGFRPGVLETNIDAVIANSQVLDHNTHAAKYQESVKTDLETESQHSAVVTTSTYAGPLKETHIFTPSKSDISLVGSTSKTPRTSESKCPIDFDYEIAAAGIIIDETVVKKEYRDIEYNPGFGLKYREESEYQHNSLPEIERETFGLNGLPTHSFGTNELPNTTQISERPREFNDFNDFVLVMSEKQSEKKTTVNANLPNSNSYDDEFSDFQSVPAPAPLPTTVPSTSIPSSVLAESKTSPSHWRKLKETETSSSGSRTGTPISLNDEMILSPAILLPQAIQMESKPKIEWPGPGINAEELARIEELFPQPKVGSNKPSPSHSGRSQQQNQPHSRTTPQPGADDDDWSDFVSVPAVATNHIQSISQQFQKRQASPAKSLSDPNDEEWSEFVSGAPPAAANQTRQYAAPQFNSAAWQNANFYNNPMSAYALPPTSFYYQPSQQNLSYNLVPNLSTLNNNTASNNNVINNNNSINQYLINYQTNQSPHHHQHQQHIQMMRDFSSSSPMDAGSISSHMAAPTIHNQYAMQAGTAYGYGNNRAGVGNIQHPGKTSQFGGGSSKVAPSISLIPDMGFVAPTRNSFISVPKNSFGTKK